MNENQEIEELERRWLGDSGRAFEQARKEALAAGCSVVEVIDGCLYEVHPDQTRKLIKHLSPRIQVKPGQRFKL